MVAQSFLSLLGILTVVTSTTFLSGEYTSFRVVKELKWVAMIVTGIIFTQLTVAASMRHTHTGLSIPDFPTAYGKWWPPLDSASVAQINNTRAVQGQAATSAAQIALQMAHRALAALTFAGVVVFAWLARHTHPLNQWGKIWMLLVGIQIGLGMWIIWSNKAADIATAHVSIGALAFFLGVQLTFRLFCAVGNSIKLLSAS
jgi:cytochrome c oxidase assembly protein subunit 15